jgi:hypothetical protein
MMETFDVLEAANFLRMSPAVVRRQAAAGIIPGGKTGKGWVFLKDDLIKYLRSIYPSNAKTLQGEHRSINKCHSTIETAGGTYRSARKTSDSEYKNLLGLKTTH